MAVVGTAVEAADSPEGDFELGEYVIRRTHVVLTNDYEDGPLVVTGAVGVPRMFQTYATANEAHGYLRCRDVRATREAPGSLVWKVKTTYKTPEKKDGGAGGTGAGGAGGGTAEEHADEFNNPLLELPEIQFTDEVTKKPITRVYNLDTGEYNAPRNSAGQVFDPPAEMDQGWAVLTITRNEDIGAPHPALGETYRFAVNTDTFWGTAAGKARVRSILAQRQTKQRTDGSTFAYLRVAYVIQFKDDWDIYLLDHGDFYVNQSMNPDRPTQRVNFTTTDGHPMKGLLDGHGGRLAERRTLGLVGDTTSASATITAIADTADARVGDRVTGTGIPDDSFVLSKTTTTLTVSHNATATGAAVGLQLSSLNDPNYQRLRPYNRLAFAALNLPQSFLEAR